MQAWHDVATPVVAASLVLQKTRDQRSEEKKWRPGTATYHPSSSSSHGEALTRTQPTFPPLISWQLSSQAEVPSFHYRQTNYPTSKLPRDRQSTANFKIHQAKSSLWYVCFLFRFPKVLQHCEGSLPDKSRPAPEPGNIILLPRVDAGCHFFLGGNWGS